MPPKKSVARREPSIPVIPDDSSFTPESFERELKSLAAKAKEDTWARAAVHETLIYGRVVVLLTLAAASANASLASLSPVYGAIPAGLYHSVLVASALFVGWSSNLYLRRLLPDNIPVSICLPLIATYVPFIHYTLSSGYYSVSTWLGARWGPVFVEAVTLFPLLVATAACVATDLEAASGVDDLIRLPRWLADALPGIGSWSFFRFAEGATAVAGTVSSTAPAALSWLSTRVASQLAIAVGYGSVVRPSRMVIFAIPPFLHTLIMNSHLAVSPWALGATNNGLRPDGWVVLDRRESVTGYVSVVENLSQGFRVLRCDHSLLGGEWTRFPANPVAEPIYGVFVMLEAVRLVQVPSKAEQDTDAKALVVGLGIGTAPAAFVAHGIDTTVVEIDPAVHDFASRYFHLPANHTAVLEDAVAYTDRLVAEQSTENGQFDYIVHDVFTGGAEPISLFTLEFLQNLHTLLKPSGVVAINYAGDFALTPIKAVVLTIRTVFPACRIFREHPQDADSTGADFANVVIFCTKNGERDSDIQFRAPRKADLLNSETRKHFLVPQYEVVDTDFRSTEEARIVRRNDTEQLAEWHAESALGHWAVMRRVVPAKVWEMW
ncbi:spermine/spermidine synthase [Sporothrix schenckii 1099-18]|uniref:Spermine/spermidine synthase n=1 Tax=Sporothrix schenckii 1099-18 TaxID=1397361 RepID=A0A0F2MHA0_SPOSC|nr:spermine/spermidine synthase [Sporothrix schenckii 1099-18]KJR88240.1 spermine/spermidine synthase [Sporothrix schenckii 1099-18]